MKLDLFVLPGFAVPAEAELLAALREVVARAPFRHGQPIVSVSLGLPAVFLFGGSKRVDKPRRVELRHGDVMVWGGPARLRYHGVMPLKDGLHPVLGRHRINLTLRRAA
jgi:alkylated DNA repair dioxygenase AlkB